MFVPEKASLILNVASKKGPTLGYNQGVQAPQTLSRWPFPDLKDMTLGGFLVTSEIGYDQVLQECSSELECQDKAKSVSVKGSHNFSRIFPQRVVFALTLAVGLGVLWCSFGTFKYLPTTQTNWNQR